MRGALQIKRGPAALMLGLACLAGCVTMRPGRGTSRREAPADAGGPMGTPPPAQEADVRVALGRTAEARGDFQQAMAAYRAALDRDRRRADACLRLAILHDRQGQFAESADLYGRALALAPGDPDIFCDK